VRSLKILLPLGIGAHLGITLWTTDPDSAASLLGISPAWLALALVLAFLPWLTNGLRLWNWLRWEGERRSLGDCLRVAVASEVGAAVTPTAVGSASVKTAMLNARGLPLPRALSLTGMGSLEDGLFFALAMPAMLVASGVWHDGALGQLVDVGARAVETPVRASIAAAITAGALLVFARTRWGRSVGGVLCRSWLEWHALLGRALTRHPFAWSTNLLLAAIQWVARYSVFTALLHGLGLEIDPVRGLVLQWLCFTFMAVIPTPGAMGGAELVFLTLFAGEVPAEVLPLVMGAWRMTTFYLLTLSGLVFLLASARERGGPDWSTTLAGDAGNVRPEN